MSGPAPSGRPGQPDVLVIGGGVIGLAIAWRAAQRGLRVTVADPAPAAGATHAAAGMLSPVAEAAYAERELFGLGRASLDRYPAFTAELTGLTGLPTGFAPTGTLQVAYDSDEHGLAQRYLTQALAYSRHASDHALAAEVLAGQAHQALYLARPDEAVDLARAAQAAAVRHGSATLLTECLVMEAHGHAARNDARACGAVLARAEQTFDRAAREDDPAWLSYFDEAYLAARMAQCFRDLGEAGHAARYARRSLDMDGRYVRGRAFNLSLLATAYAAQGESVQASAVGRQALDLTVRLTSARSIRYVRDLVRALSPQADFPAVRDFTAEVRERLPAAAGHAAPR